MMSYCTKMDIVVVAASEQDTDKKQNDKKQKVKQMGQQKLSSTNNPIKNIIPKNIFKKIF